ncbi:MAG: glycosyltransferase family 2 protein, partial [Candidatus Izemoplasmatales bacterium]
MQKVAAVVIAHNEEKDIRTTLRILNALKAKGHINEIIVVNDGSTDHTVRIAEEMGATVVSNKKNLGKRQAFITGAYAVKKTGAEIMLSLDADITKFPEETLRKMIETVSNGKTHMATAQQMEWASSTGHYFETEEITSRAQRAINMRALEPLFRKNKKWLQILNSKIPLNQIGHSAKATKIGLQKTANESAKWGLEAALEALVPKNKRVALKEKIFTSAPFRRDFPNTGFVYMKHIIFPTGGMKKVGYYQ